MIDRTAPVVRAVVLLLGAAVAAGCGGATREAGPRVVVPGAPGEASRVVDGGSARSAPARHTEGEVRFMQDMIVHHAQALVMTGLVADRTEREDIRLLAGRILASQEEEIALMERWLRNRGEDLPSLENHDVFPRGGAAGHHHAGMPGMLTAEQLSRLAAATGAEFDRLFLELMIYHHEGAVLMVAELLSGDSGGQDPEIFRFAAHVDADQRVEIARMRRMLESSTTLQRGSE